MEEQRTRNFTQSGTGIIDIDGVKVHARWRLAGTQEYVVGAGTAVDGRRIDVALAVYFDKLADESAVVQELLDRIAADLHRPLAVDVGRTSLPLLYCQEIRTDSSGNASGINLTDQPASEAKSGKKTP